MIRNKGYERVKSGEVQPKPQAEEVDKHLAGVGRIVAVASGKGGVGKSTVAAGLAVELAAMGYRVGVLDADIYGPSQPLLFGVEGYVPVSEDGKMIEPVINKGVKIMSIGFFIGKSDALIWRGPMAVNALRQLTRQTVWGEIDFLVVDLPPGTGDVHLNIAHELEIDGAVVVSTPGVLAQADVRRGVEMFKADGVGVPILGVVENMAWFSPSELPDNKYFIFGKGGGEFAAELGVELLAEIPLVLGDGETNAGDVAIRPELAPYFRQLAQKVVGKLSK